MPAWSHDKSGKPDSATRIFIAYSTPFAPRLVAKREGCLRTGRLSAGVDEMVQPARWLGKAVYFSLEGIPDAEL